MTFSTIPNNIRQDLISLLKQFPCLAVDIKDRPYEYSPLNTVKYQRVTLTPKDISPRLCQFCVANNITVHDIKRFASGNITIFNIL